MFGSTSAQRGAAAAFVEENGGEVRSKWKKSIHVNYNYASRGPNGEYGVNNRNQYFRENGRIEGGAAVLNKLIDENYDYWATHGVDQHGRTYQKLASGRADYFPVESFFVPLPPVIAAVRGFRAARAVGAVAEEALVWDAIKATQPVYKGSILPRSFEIATPSGKRFWVHGNATEHMAEFLKGKAVDFNPAYIKLVTQEQLRSLQAALEGVSTGPFLYDEMLYIGRWELKIGAPKAAGQLPTIYHALPF